MKSIALQVLANLAGIAIPLSMFSVSRAYRSIDASYKFYGALLEVCIRLRENFLDGTSDGIEPLLNQCAVEVSLIPARSTYREYWKSVHDMWKRYKLIPKNDLENTDARLEKSSILDDINNKINQLRGPLRPCLFLFVSDLLTQKQSKIPKSSIH